MTDLSSFVRPAVWRSVAALIAFIFTAVPCLAQPTGEVGEPFEARLVPLAGTAPHTWQILDGQLPPGLSLDRNTGVIGGIPTRAGTFSFTVRWIDSEGLEGFPTTHSITIEPAPAPPPELVITTASPLPAGAVGVGYSQSIEVTGGEPPYFMSITLGSLPPGLSITRSSLRISGIPLELGIFTFTVTVSSQDGGSASKAFSLTIAPPLAIVTESLPDGTVGESYSASLTAEGGVLPHSWSLIECCPPPGLVFLRDGGLNGIPSEEGVFSFSVRVMDTGGNIDERGFSVTIAPQAPPPTITIDTGSLAGGTVGVSYSQVLQASGGSAPYSWNVIGGALPTGLSLAGTGSIGGIPTQAGRFSFRLRVSDAEGSTTEGGFSITIDAPPLVIETRSPLPQGTVGTQYSHTVSASGGIPPFTWSVVQGEPPPGITLDASGRVTGIPIAAGTFGFTAEVVDSAGTISRRHYSLIVNPPGAPEVTISGLPDQSGPAEQLPLGVILTTAYPLPLTGRATLTFTSNAAVPVDDPGVQFSSGGRQVDFTIAAGDTAAVFPVEEIALQTGSVAGTIEVTARLWTAGIEVTPSPQPAWQVQIERSAPVITSVQVVRTTSGFEVQLVGISTSREVTRATFRFTAAAQANLQTTSIEVPLSEAAAAWYQSEASTPFGSAFRYSQSFMIQGESTAVSRVSVTLSNAQGDSQSVDAEF